MPLALLTPALVAGIGMLGLLGIARLVPEGRVGLGTRQPAEAGQLLVLAAGPSQGRAAVQPVLEAVGARTVWTGEDSEAASATRLKLVTNSWILAVDTAAKDARLIVAAGARRGARLDVAAANVQRLDRRLRIFRSAQHREGATEPGADAFGVEAGQVVQLGPARGHRSGDTGPGHQDPDGRFPLFAGRGALPRIR